MLLNRKEWNDWKTRKPCPYCQNGRLFPLKDIKTGKQSVLESETLSSKIDYRPYQEEFYVSVHLECNKCKDIVIAVLRKNIDFVLEEDGETKYIYITQCYFHPAPYLINIPVKCPSSLRKLIKESFSLFWIDIESCANRIRISVEELMNLLMISKTYLSTKKKRIKLSLHERIIKYKTKNPEIGELLLSLKWIGNAGSHNSKLIQDDIFDSYEILELVLKKLYDTKESEIIKLSTKINKKKKPLSKNRKK